LVPHPIPHLLPLPLPILPSLLLCNLTNAIFIRR
jgi:hypothetical protein